MNAGPGELGPAGVAPDLLGICIDQAIGAANRVGLRATVVPPSGEVETLVASGQSLVPGTRVVAGDVITLTLG